MIRINKGAAPQKLLEVSSILIAKQIADYEGHEKDFNAKGFAITEDYKMDDVKNSLLERQYKKCCFSEAKFSGDYPHVEHFRPKGLVVESTTKKKLYPGYYWLAYDWSNLLICKQLINVSYKQNFFPLSDESQRNRCHKDNYNEVPILIDPSTEDPRIHIQFHKDEIKPISERGLENIKLLGLRHSDFVESRANKFAHLSTLKNVVDSAISQGISTSHPTVKESIELLNAATKPDAEFSSMAIDLLSGWPHLESSQGNFQTP